jgi:hypothetical protein
MQSETVASRPVLPYDARSVMAAGICLASLFFDAFGWLLAIVGILLLRRAAFPARIKWILAAIALAPKILFLGVQSLRPPAELTFTIEPWTLATSSALWSWSTLLAGFGSVLVRSSGESPGAPEALVQPTSSGSPLLKAAGLALIAAAGWMLLGLGDDFQGIQAAGDGRWVLQHAVRGAVATFTRDEVASIEALDRRTRGSASFPVRIALTNGRTFSASTRSNTALEGLRKFAATADLRPGTARLRSSYHGDWTNGGSGLKLRDCMGTYEFVDERLGERSTIEIWPEKGRLAGKETILDRQGGHVRVLRGIKISDTGEMEFHGGFYALAQGQSKSAVSFSMRWDADAESGKFTKDGLEIGSKKFRKLRAQSP